MIMAVADLSITKVMPSIPHDNNFLPWSSAIANSMAYILGIGLHSARRRILRRRKTFLLSLAKIEAKMVDTNIKIL